MRGHRIATVICFEAIYAPLVRRFVNAGAEVLVNISNDGWFGEQPSLEQHFWATQLRAVESRRYLLRATNAGITAVVDPRGAIVEAAPRATATFLVADVVPITTLTWYTRLGDSSGGRASRSPRSCCSCRLAAARERHRPRPGTAPAGDRPGPGDSPAAQSSRRGLAARDLASCSMAP